MTNKELTPPLKSYMSRWYLDDAVVEMKIPPDTRVADAVAHVNGVFPLPPSKRAALAVTPVEVALCVEDGIAWSVHLAEINRVEVVEFKGFSLSIGTKGGRVVQMNAPNPFGIRIITTMPMINASDQVDVFTQTRMKADGWATIILSAMRGMDRRAQSPDFDWFE